MRSLRTSVLQLTSANVTGQLIGAAGLPLVAMLYGPETIGAYGVAFAVASTLRPVLTARLELGVVSEPDDAGAAQAFFLTVTCLLMSLLVLALTSGALWLIASSRATAQVLPMIGAVTAIAVPAALVDIGYHLCVREKRFVVMSAASVLRSLSTVGAQLVLGAASLGVLGLLLGTAAGSLLAASVLIAPNRALLLRASQLVSLSSLRSTLTRLWKYPRYSLPTAIVEQASEASILLLAPFFFSPAEVGRIALGQRLVTTPSNPLLQALRSTSLGALRHADPQRRLKAVGAVARWSLMGGVPALLAFGMLGESFLVMFLGAEWSGTASISLLLLAWLLFRLPSSIANSLLVLQDRQQVLFRASAAGMLARAVAVMVGGVLAGPLVAVALYAIAGAVNNLAVTAAAISGERTREAEYTREA